jgi:hypothetical protein
LWGRRWRSWPQREKDSASKHLQIVEDLVAAVTKLDGALTMALGGRATN